MSNADKLAAIQQRVVDKYYVFIDRGQYGNDYMELREAQDDVAFLLFEIDRLQSIQQEHDLLKQVNEKVSTELLSLRESEHSKAYWAREGLIQRLQQERDKIIEGLRDIAESDDDWYVGSVPMREYAARLLKEIGVGEERT